MFWPTQLLRAYDLNCPKYKELRKADSQSEEYKMMEQQNTVCVSVPVCWSVSLSASVSILILVSVCQSVCFCQYSYTSICLSVCLLLSVFLY